MRKNRKLYRAAAALMTAAMLSTMGGMTAFAEGNSGITSSNGETSVSEVKVTKTVTAPEGTMKPNTSFTFNVEAATEGGTFTDSTNNTYPVLEGVTGGLTGAMLDFSAITDTGTHDDEKGQVSYVGTTALTVHEEYFNEPGVYHYVVSESTDSLYAGIINDDTVYDVYVSVWNKTNANGTTNLDGRYVSSVVSVKRTNRDVVADKVSEATGAKSDLAFTNVYETGKLTVKKDVQGNQGKKTDMFEFTVSIEPDTKNEETYTVIIKESENAEPVKKIVTSSAGVKTALKDGGSIEIFGLSAGDKYTVTETKDNLGYTTYIGNREPENEGSTKTDTLADDDGKVTSKEVIVINYKNASTPTGIITNYGPYMLLVFAAGACAVVFFRRRREDY